MSDEDVDYKALYEQIQKELTAARFTILRMKHKPEYTIDGDALRVWIQKNYLVIVVSIMLATFVLSSLKTFKEIRRMR